MSQSAPNLGLIGNDAKFYVKPYGESTWTQVKGVVDINPPDQSFNGVDLPYLDEESRITEQVKGSRNGGDLTFNINAKSATDEGLGKILEMHEDVEHNHGFKWVYSNGAASIIDRGVLLGCALQPISKDAVISYACTVHCNSKMYNVEAESGSGSGRASGSGAA